MDEGKNLRILLLEDNVDDVQLIERALEKGNLQFVNECVDTRDEFSAAILRFEPDVILSDHGLPGFNSREALKICQREKMTMPFILVTGTISDENAVDCLRNGADDFVLKSNLSKLPSAIRAALRRRKIEKFKNQASRVLNDQNEELKKSNSELQALIFKSSQNLRGPFSSMLGLIDAARQENTNQRMLSILEMLERCVAVGDQTLKDLQDYSHNVKDRLTVSEINWADQVASALKEINPVRQNNRNRIVANLKTNESFHSDADRLSIILKAVVSNAMVFRHNSVPSKIDIEVITTPSHAIVTVTDNGIGISKEALPKVFDMFFREAEENPGAGLGLYIAREAIKRLGGDLKIRSVPNEETIVTALIPNLKPASVNP